MSLALDDATTGKVNRSASEVRAYLLAELSKSLNVRPAEIDTTAPLDQMGVDSLMALGMAGGLAGWLDRDIPATLLWDYRTVDAIAEALATALPERTLPAGIVPLQPDGDGIPIFGFPGLAGTPLAFAALAAKLGNSQPFYGVAVPGYEGVSGSYETIEGITAAMLKMIRQVRPHGPYRLAGYCFGGLLVYEAARQLAAAGEEVSLLAIFDAFTRVGWVKRPLWQLPFIHLHQLVTGKKKVGEFFGKLSWTHLSKKVKPVDVETRIQNDLAKSTAAARLWNLNALAAAKYRAGPYAGPVNWFRASERESYDVFFKTMSCGGWSRCTTGGVTAIKIPGNHGNLIGPEHADTAAAALRPFLAAR